MGEVLAAFVKDRSGVTSIEYAVIALGVSLLLVAGATSLGHQLKHLFRLITVVPSHGRTSML